MVALIEDKRDSIAALCRRFGVVRMDVFGSVLREDFRPGKSDVDLLVEFSDRDPYELAQAYFDLLDELKALLGGEVDLVMAGAIKNPYIASDIETTKRLLYAASPLAYLNDIVVCCDAIAETLDGVDLPAYASTRTLRSAVEREFTIIGEAVNSLSKIDPDLISRISHTRMIVGFRNQLVHDYPAILDSAVWAIAQKDAPILRAECAALIKDLVDRSGR